MVPIRGERTRTVPDAIDYARKQRRNDLAGIMEADFQHVEGDTNPTPESDSAARRRLRKHTSFDLPLAVKR